MANREMLRFLWVGREKFKGPFCPLVLLCDTEGVLQNWNGETSLVDRRSVSSEGGLKWKVYRTSAGTWVNIDLDYWRKFK